MSERTDKLDFMFRGGATTRYHAEYTLQSQNVAAHSFGVVCILMCICDNNVRPHLLFAAVTHDLKEQHLGDIPSPGKKLIEEFIPGFREAFGKAEQRGLCEHGLAFEALLTPNEHRLLKLADCLEAMMYCLRERQMGNQLLSQPFAKMRAAADALLFRGDSCELEILNHIVDLWEIANDEC